MIPRPTTTSQAAITITIRAKTWPSWSPRARLKASSARLPAFSISSRQSRITSGLRRRSTPAAPVAKIRADSTRYQVRSTGGPLGAGGFPFTVATGQHDCADCRDEKKQGGGLEGDQEPLQQQPPDLA